MLSDAEIESQVLSFLYKSYGYVRSVARPDGEVVLFRRTETESESRLRPKVVHLWLAVPRERLLEAPSGEELALGRDGIPGPRPPGSAVESAAERNEVTEQGFDWRRFVVDGGFLYVPRERADSWASAAGLAALGLSAPAPSRPRL